MTERKRLVVNTYRGPTDGYGYQRDQTTCHRLWNHEYTIPTFDELVSRQLQIALRENRNEVVCLDVGVGKARLFYSFLEAMDRDEGKASEIIRNNPQLQLHLVGFNDAPDKSRFLKKVELKDTFVPYPNIHLALVYYTLARDQGISKLLDSLGFSKIDQVTATAALHYLGPQNFAEFMEDIIISLRGKGSRFIGLGYCDNPVGLSVNNFGEVKLNVGGGLRGKTPEWLRIYQDKGECFGYDCDLGLEKSAIRQLEQVFLRNGVICNFDVEQTLKHAYDLMGRPFQSFDQTSDLYVIRAFVESLVALIERNVINQRRVVDEIAKKDILAGLKNKYRDEVYFIYTHETINIERNRR